MNWSKLGIHLLILTFSIGCSTKEETTTHSQSHASKHLMEVDELKKIIESDSIKIIDMRSPEEYAQAHLPKAIHIWRQDIQDNDLPYSGKIASKEQLEQLFRAKGIRASDFLVVYDDKSSCEAARMWWVLDYYGFDRVAILHGGIKAWQKVQPVTNSTNVPIQSNFTFKQPITQSRMVEIEELKQLMGKENVVVLDTRTEQEYRGSTQKRGAYASGRIPNSINIDWMAAMNGESQTFKNRSELASIYKEAGIADDLAIITYCHSGVRSAHTLFVLTELLGYENSRNYDGSWVEWTYHQLPIERDSLITN